MFVKIKYSTEMKGYIWTLYNDNCDKFCSSDKSYDLTHKAQTDFFKFLKYANLKRVMFSDED